VRIAWPVTRPTKNEGRVDRLLRDVRGLSQLEEPACPDLSISLEKFDLRAHRPSRPHLERESYSVAFSRRELLASLDVAIGHEDISATSQPVPPPKSRLSAPLADRYDLPSPSADRANAAMAWRLSDG